MAKSPALAPTLFVVTATSPPWSETGVVGENDVVVNPDIPVLDIATVCENADSDALDLIGWIKVTQSAACVALVHLPAALLTN
jgi:hypothetical protein